MLAFQASQSVDNYLKQSIINKFMYVCIHVFLCMYISHQGTFIM